VTGQETSARVVILNDTSERQHHGCSRVMRILKSGLNDVGFQIIATAPARHDWAADMNFKAALAAADLIVINGEGTLHHGRPAGEALVRVVDELTARGRPVALVNALYQSNPKLWARHLRQMALLAARDARSGAQMAAAAPDVPLRVMPDLSLCEGAIATDAVRDLVIFGDSVRLNQRRALVRAARNCDADMILPMKTRRSWPWRLGPLKRALYAGYCGMVSPVGRVVLVADEAAYIETISRAKMHVTGRFHSVCLSLVTGTPFLALGSNSWKVEALLDEAGVAADRLVSLDELAQMGRADMDRPFTVQEKANIAGFLTHAQDSGDRLFRDLAALAQAHKP